MYEGAHKAATYSKSVEQGVQKYYIDRLVLQSLIGVSKMNFTYDAIVNILFVIWKYLIK